MIWLPVLQIAAGLTASVGKRLRAPDGAMGAVNAKKSNFMQRQGLIRLIVYKLLDLIEYVVIYYSVYSWVYSCMQIKQK